MARYHIKCRECDLINPGAILTISDNGQLTLGSMRISCQYCGHMNSESDFVDASKGYTPIDPQLLRPKRLRPKR